MARELGVGTIAEGVETQEQFDILARCGCDAIQGYLLSRPLEASAALDVSRKSLRRPVWANAQRFVAAAG